MRNLIWQYHIDTNRGYDGPYRKKMAMASSALVSFYAMKCEVAYEMGCYSNWYKSGYHGGPAMERFQLLEERYDIYDYILYLDTDILISTEAPSIFDSYPGANLAGIHMPHPRDMTLLEQGWLKEEFPNSDCYRSNYVNGAILLMSREFRQYLRSVFDIENIQIDRGTHWDSHGLAVRWPVYDQSMVSYYLAKSHYSLTKLACEWYKGPYFYNFGGGKTDTNIKRFFADYYRLQDQWIARDTLPK